MTYDETTGQVIFNGRNKTAKLPNNNAFPQRMIVEQHEETTTEEATSNGQE